MALAAPVNSVTNSPGWHSRLAQSTFTRSLRSARYGARPHLGWERAVRRGYDR